MLLLYTVEHCRWSDNLLKMNKLCFSYSLKNIALPKPDAYLRNLIEKTESLVNRLRWKAHLFINRNSSTQQHERFGLQSRKSAPIVAELKPFEEELAAMIENVRFRNMNDHFLNSLSRDVKKIESTPNVLVFADKTRNIYEMDAEKYNKLLPDNKTKHYKLGNETTMEDINNELKNIAKQLDIDNRIEPMAQRQAFISLKDQKNNFENHPKCRLINPAKSELGKVSKTYLDIINTKIRAATNANQWRNSAAVINWFNSLNDKIRHTFLSFDIIDFYPSISEDLLNKALSWATNLVTITDQQIKVIMHARKSLLFNKEKPRVKKGNTTPFDVTMGSYDGAEVCELVGLFILNSLEKIFGKKVDLYRDDGLAAINTSSPRLADKTGKDIIQIFNNFGLKITTQINLKSANFLDITLNLPNGTYQPYRKPNDEPLYINKRSNHPPAILKQLPMSINKRISNLSCNQETFETAAPIYENALRHSNFVTQLTYIENESDDQTNASQTRQQRNRSRNIIWYNPPYSRNVRTNIGRTFLNLIDKHFTKTNKLHKILNRNTSKSVTVAWKT